MNATGLALVSSLICCLWLPSFAFTQAVANRHDVVRKAAQAYYNLPKEGFVSFRCTLAPNYDALDPGLRQSNPAAADARLQTLSQLHVAVVVEADGKATVSHNDVAAPYLKDVVRNLDLMMTSFFQLWSPYVVESPFPAVDSEYQVEDLGSQYRLSYKEGLASVAMTLDKDSTVGAVMVTRPEVNSVTWPQFTKTPKGFLPVSLDNDVRIPSQGGAAHVRTVITYQEVAGLQLPKTIKNTVTSNGTSYESEVALTGCAATKR
jgi:hypothetical protein